MMGKTHSAVGVASALAVNMILSKGEPSILGLFLTSVCVYMIAPFFVPYFVAGFLSHVGIDLLNRRHVHLLYPIHGKGICFGFQ